MYVRLEGFARIEQGGVTWCLPTPPAGQRRDLCVCMYFFWSACVLSLLIYVLYLFYICIYIYMYYGKWINVLSPTWLRLVVVAPVPLEIYAQCMEVGANVCIMNGPNVAETWQFLLQQANWFCCWITLKIQIVTCNWILCPSFVLA